MEAHICGSQELRQPVGAGKLMAMGQSAAGTPQHPPVTERPKNDSPLPSSASAVLR